MPLIAQNDARIITILSTNYRKDIGDKKGAMSHNNRQKRVDYSLIEEQFKALQSRPIPKKIEQIKQIMLRNHNLTIHNNNLHKCIHAISHSIKDSENEDIFKIIRQLNLQVGPSQTVVDNLMQKLSIFLDKSSRFKKTNLKKSISASASIKSTASFSRTQKSYQTQFSNTDTFGQSNYTQNQLPYNQLKSINEQLKNINRQQSLKISKYQQELIIQHQNMIQKQAKIKKYQQNQTKIKQQLKKMTEFCLNLHEIPQNIQKTIQQFKCKIKETQNHIILKIDQCFKQYMQKLSQNQYNKLYNFIVCHDVKDTNKSVFSQLSREIQKLIKQKARKFNEQNLQELANNIQKYQNQYQMKKIQTCGQSKQDNSSQRILSKFKQLYSQKMKLQSIIKQKQTKILTVQTNKQLIQKNPTLSFLYSRVLPIFNVQNSEQNNKIKNTQDFIVSSIQNYYKRNMKIISHFQLLFGFTNLRQARVDFHFLVEDKPNLLLIIKLKNETILGAYSESGMTQQNKYNKNSGFLFDARDKKIYTARQRFRKNAIIPYDDFHIIVGNHDLKIRMDSTSIQSCFGTQSSVFRPNSSCCSSHLLHQQEGVDKTQLIDYEFYQVFFQQNQQEQ